MNKGDINISDLLIPGNVVSEDIHCIHCKHLKLPIYQKQDCGCRICESCLQQNLNNRTACPGQSEECSSSYLTLENDTSNTFPDNAAKRDIQRLSMRCPFNLYGCNETGKVSLILGSHFDVCSYKPETCEFCNNAVKNLAQHLQNECPKRPVECRFCRKTMEAIELQEKHYNWKEYQEECCEQSLYSCPYCEDKTELIKKDLQYHLEKICPMKPGPCSFKPLGCTVFGSVNEIMHHNKENMQDHLFMLSTNLKSDIDEMPEIQEDVTLLYTRNVFVSEKIINIPQLENLKRIIYQRLDATGRLPASIESLPSNVPLPTSSPPILQNLSLQQEMLSNSIKKSGNHTWIFSDFDRKQRTGHYFDSDKFYTDTIGYRLRIRIYPKGNGRSAGQFLSLYFAIVHGEYDDLLEWPMKLNVTLEILPVNDNSGSLPSRGKRQTYCMGMDTDPFKKPVPDEANTAVGNPRFLPLMELSQYLKNDKLFIQCRVARQ